MDSLQNSPLSDDLSALAWVHEELRKSLDAAHKVRHQWANTPPAERSAVLLRIADRIEQNLERLAVAETIDNGNAMIWMIGLMEALISAMNKANAAMPSTGGSPMACMPGRTATIMPAATVRISQREIKRPITTSYSTNLLKP